MSELVKGTEVVVVCPSALRQQDQSLLTLMLDYSPHKKKQRIIVGDGKGEASYVLKAKKS